MQSLIRVQHSTGAYRGSWLHTHNVYLNHWCEGSLNSINTTNCHIGSLSSAIAATILLLAWAIGCILLGPLRCCYPCSSTLPFGAAAYEHARPARSTSTISQQVTLELALLHNRIPHPLIALHHMYMHTSMHYSRALRIVLLLHYTLAP